MKRGSSSVKDPVLVNRSLVGDWYSPEKRIWVPVRYNHPLVGTWQEVDNQLSVTSIVYNIAVVNGKFAVSGDEESGTKLKISAVKWNGTSLSFTGIYPPTRHRTKHVIEARRRGIINHWITYTVLEIWRKRSEKR